MINHLPVLVILFPLVIGLMAPMLSLVSSSLSRFTAIGGALLTFISACALIKSVVPLGQWHYFFGGWNPPWGIEFVIDPLSAGIIAMIALLSLLVIIFAGPYFEKETAIRQGSYYGLHLLLTCGLIGMVATGDLFNLYVFLEIAALSTYALVAMGKNHAKLIAFRYLLIGTVGASFYLLGVGFIYAATGTLNMQDLARLLPQIIHTKLFLTASVLILIGMALKSGFFPFHSWVPDTYANAPPPVSAFISSAMNKTSIYVILRIFFYLFSGQAILNAIFFPVGILAVIGMMFAAAMAIKQNDLFRLLAYSSVGQICYLFLMFAIGTPLALAAAMIHLFAHSFTKAGLFMCAGLIELKTGLRKIKDLKGVAQKLPLTLFVFLFLALSMIGLPPFVGFFSKWYLFKATVVSQQWIFLGAIFFSSLLGIVYFFKIIEVSFLMDPKTRNLPVRRSLRSVGGKPETYLEAPLSMLIPLISLGLLVITLGVFNGPFVAKYIQFVIPFAGGSL